MKERFGRIAGKVAGAGAHVKLVEGSLDRGGFAVLVGYDFGVASMMFEVVTRRAEELGKSGLNVARALARSFPVLMANRLDVDVVAQPGRGLVLKCWLMCEWTDGHDLFARTPADELRRRIEDAARAAL